MIPTSSLVRLVAIFAYKSGRCCEAHNVNESLRTNLGCSLGRKFLSYRLPNTRYRNDGASSPHRVDQVCDRINEKTADNEQYRPYQIVDLLLEFRENTRCLLRPPHKDGTQRENDRHGSRNDDDELIHKLATYAASSGQATDFGHPEPSQKRRPVRFVLCSVPCQAREQTDRARGIDCGIRPSAVPVISIPLALWCSPTSAVHVASRGRDWGAGTGAGAADLSAIAASIFRRCPSATPISFKS